MRGWRVIKGYDKYRILKDGRVWSLRSRKFIKQWLNVDCYYRVELVKNGQRKWHFVHRLVADHFRKNKNPELYKQVNHKNWDRHDNNSCNLEHVSASINIIHSRKKHSNEIYLGDGRWKKLTHEQAKERAGTPF